MRHLRHTTTRTYDIFLRTSNLQSMSYVHQISLSRLISRTIEGLNYTYTSNKRYHRITNKSSTTLQHEIDIKFRSFKRFYIFYKLI